MSAGQPSSRTEGVCQLDTCFRTALKRLDAAGRLIKVQTTLDRDLEVAGYMKHFDGDRALLFEDVRGAAMPVVGNVLASVTNVETVFGMDSWGVRGAMMRTLQDTPLPPVMADDDPVHDVVYATGIDLNEMLPILRHTASDGGRFITAGVVLTNDPETGVGNASYHRLQLVGPSRTAIKLDFGRHLRSAFESACQSGRPLPIAVCIGTDVALMYAAAFMGSQMPASADEMAAAGALRGAPIETVPCVSQPLAVPAETEIVLEGRLLVDESVEEGPFGEFVGYLSDKGPAPVFDVTAVTMRQSPVYHAINGVGRETIMLRKHVLEACALQAVRSAVPIVTDAELTAGGLHRFHLVLQVAKKVSQHEGMQRNAMLAAFAALKDLDLIVVVDDDIDIHDPDDVEYALATRMEASQDLVVVPEARGHEYVRVSNRGVEAKLGIDATVPVAERSRFARVPFAEPGTTEAGTVQRGVSSLPWLGGDMS